MIIYWIEHMLKIIRIVFWIAVVVTGLFQLWDGYRALQWRTPLHVALYPVNADGSEEVDTYIASLNEEDFDVLEQFFNREARKYQLGIAQPIIFHLGPRIQDVPAAPPAVGGSWLDILIWSLKFRWYSWHHQPEVGVPVDISLYLLYHDASQNKRLQHSTALQKGRIGRVNLFAAASQHDMNTVVIAHELLHTLSATDKYDLATNKPLFPQGYAEPYMEPRYPQSHAEIMAGRIPLQEHRSRMAKHLNEAVIGRPTAREIGWAY